MLLLGFPPSPLSVAGLDRLHLAATYNKRNSDRMRIVTYQTAGLSRRVLGIKCLQFMNQRQNCSFFDLTTELGHSDHSL